ncbi:sugar phosphate isomerase/epimerase, partial [Candidatus Poribacteria bacterium]|nr:sugar phosphate isomerase/epimerase [Candidatus Poribacteria bacterium]
PRTTQSDVDKDKVQLASLDNDERKEAIRRTIQTMQLAIDMEIPTVILRLGEVDTYNRSYLMTDLYNYGEREFEAFNKKVTEATEWRKRKEAKHHDAALRSLDELNEAALRLELNIAIENRPQYFQIPNFDEVGLFFDEFYGSPMRYWHDVGHAALQEKLGLCWSQEWIRTYGEHLIGVTLHDLQELDPYHPPGTGDLDWDEIFAQIPNEAVKVIEIKHVNSEEIIQARELCESFTPIE